VIVGATMLESIDLIVIVIGAIMESLNLNYLPVSSMYKLCLASRLIPFS